MTSRIWYHPMFNYLQTTVSFLRQSNQSTTQPNCSRTLVLLRKGKRTVSGHFTLRSVPPSTFIKNAIRSKHLTNCTVIPWKMSQVINTGITTSRDLSWREHIKSTPAKATRLVGFLRRNLLSCPQAISADKQK